MYIRKRFGPNPQGTSDVGKTALFDCKSTSLWVHICKV